MKYKFYFLRISLIIVFINNFKSFAQEFRNNNLIWQSIPNSKDIKNKKLDIIWKNFSEDDLIKIFSKRNSTIKKASPKEYKNSTLNEYLKPLEILPSLQINNFPDEGILSNVFSTKSSFDGGAATGTGNQNYSYKVDFGINDNTYISGFVSEADDPYYYKINNTGDLPSKNFWRVYGLSFNRKLFFNNSNKLNLSLNSSLELWDLATIYKKSNIANDWFSGRKSIGSISTPLTYKVSENANITIAPRVSFLPKNLGRSLLSETFYNDNFTLGFGIDLKLSKDFYLLSSYTFPMGPGYNSFDNNLNFSRNNIYSFGFKWDPSPRLGITAGITNSFGDTPATGHLTIPSGNIPLYSFKLRLNSGYFDPPQKSFNSREQSLLHKGHSVNNALIPKKGKNQINLNIDDKGNFFGFYGYSFSDLFQVEIANIGAFNNINLNKNDEFKTLKNTYMGRQNFNNRFGGTLNLLSPTKGDTFWLSKRITIGRDQKSNQGYLFSELLSTFKLNPKTALNINPKLSWSGIRTISGLGLGINHQINNKIQLIPELNYSFSSKNYLNSTLIFRYIPSKNKSFDIYLSNAEGTQDLSQLLKSEEIRFGLKFNFIF